MINDCLIRSFLEDDLYNFNMGSVVFHDFPNAIVTYKWILRSKVAFPKGFAEELQNQIELLSKLTMTDAEAEWFGKTVTYHRPTYIEWLRNYRMNPREVTVIQNGTDLEITIRGYWYRTIFWEVKLLALVSELYFRLTNQPATGNWKDKIYTKGKRLSDAGCHWMDFSMRRRHSFETQDAVVETMRDLPGFIGTSNPHLAMKYGIKPLGTYAHQAIMAMSARYGVRMADKMWRQHWTKHFNGEVGIALTDTFTSDFFWKNFDGYEARLFDGCRQDSGDEYKWGIKMLDRYQSLRVPTGDKKMVFSNGLDVDKYIPIDQYFRKFAKPSAGIGTNFSNDCGVKPLNMVIKLIEADFGNGPVGVVKLSDDLGKYTGTAKDVAQAKAELGIQE